MLARMTNLMNDFAPFFGPASPMGPVGRLLEEFFDDLPAARPYAAGYPAVNLWEDADGAWVEAELPGLGMDDVEVLVADDRVTINGRRDIADPQNTNWHRRERARGQFSRTLTLPWPVDADKVEARLQDGVLTVKLPKCEACKPKKVKVVGA